MERTLILVKPDGVQRGLVGEVISRFERKGLKLISLKIMRAGDELLQEHYAHIADKPFFVDVKRYMQSSPIVAMAWEGLECADAVRILVGPTKAREAAAGTIRGDLAMSQQNNLLHASDSAENGQIEVGRFFKSDELFEYDKTEYQHIYADYEQPTT
jgi:nucleoside-diphosphate kinase